MFKRPVSILICVISLSATLFAQTSASSISYDPPLSWRYASEQEWIVSDVVATLARLADAGRKTSIGNVRVTTLPAVGTVLRFSVDASGEQTTIEIRDHIWAPANYLPLVKKWIAGRSRASVAASPSDILSALTAPRIDVLESTNREIGRRLSAKSPSRTDYDDAALLLGVMGLREGPSYGDVRPFLSRMTAYLAMAQSLSATPTPSGRVAEILQLALTQRQRDGVDRLQKWEAASPSPLDRSWILALRMRFTGDWRVLARPNEATLIERIEYARALEQRRGQTALLDFLDASHPEDIPDWTRIAVARAHYTVESANRFSDEAVRAELKDAAYVWERVSNRPQDTRADLAALLDGLNDDQTADKNLALDWPTWAASFERHLARDIAAMVERESFTFGRPDAARTEAKSLEEAFGRLTSFPIAKLRYALDDAQYADAMKNVIGLMQRHPDLLMPESWLRALEPRNGRLPGGVTPQSVWFRTLEPYGTAQDADERVYLYRQTNHLTLASLHDLRSVAPYSRFLIEEEFRWRYRRPAVPPLAEYTRELGGLVEYDAEALSRLVSNARSDQAAYLPLAERLCELQVSQCQTLAQYLADHGRDDDAARVYRRWMDRDRDAVGVANGSSWLIDYYYSHGQQPAAIALADKAAEAYSFRGLMAKARLLERLGDYRGAEAIQKAASERYKKISDLAPFYIRWAKASHDPGVRSAGDTLVATVFPRGLERFVETANAPGDGVRVTNTGARGAKAGFAIGDVIVAVDGIAVHNYDQFLMAWKLDATPEITFTTWKDGKYVAVSGALRDLWISGTFVAYRVPAQK
jgi:hypothetical protein